MKKIALFTAVSLMTSVAFGQVNWGEFENYFQDVAAKEAVETSFKRHGSSCAIDANMFEMKVFDIEKIEGAFQESPVFRVYMSHPMVKTIVELSTDDLYHGTAWETQLVYCWPED